MLQFIESTTFCTIAIVFVGSTFCVIYIYKPDLQFLMETQDTAIGEMSKKVNKLIYRGRTRSM